MIGLPKPGERVTFSAAEGHRVPIPGRPGSFYRAGETVTETWSFQHHSRLMAGALVLIDWPGKPPPPPPAGGEPPATGAEAATPSSAAATEASGGAPVQPIEGGG